MDLGAPIGGTHQYNPQSGGSGFNAGLGGEHASGDIPKGTPIADKYSSSANTSGSYGQQSSGLGLGGEKLDNSLDNYSGEQGAGQGETVSGAYSGGGTGNALTGESHARTTGAGVGVYGENLESSGGHHHHHHHHHHERDAALAGTAGGAAGLAASSGYDNSGSARSTEPLTRGEGLAGYGGQTVPGVGGEYGSGVGPSSGETYQSSGNSYESGRGSSNKDVGYGAAGVGAGVGAGEYESGKKDVGYGAAGVGAGVGAGEYESGKNSGSGNGASTEGIPTSKDDLKGSGTGATREDALGSSVKGKPVSDPKELDTGGPHSLVYQESTGKYVHRRDL